ncbi:GNAT family N-acetyltransferase [Streptomyces sp. NPDC014734]|uniref:GNAT family N-acetyltransferase n=1 Tax=Streptomyces sp. NPDC014734 TaxID=3364886 RepID=UPI0036FEE759
MSAPLSRALAELRVRRLTPADLVACADLCEDRGWPRDEHRWGLLLAAGIGYGIDDPAEGGGLAATCVVTSYGPRLAAVGMLLVAGRHARQGIARHLMRRVIDAAGDTPLSLYATPAGRPLYEQLGFEAVARAERVTGNFVPTSGDEPGKGIRPATAEDLHALVRLDTEVFGVDRTHVLARLPAYADHLRVAEENGGIVGYAAAWPSAGTQVIGPLIAPDTRTAQGLITSLAAATDLPLRMDIDARHAELLVRLKERGLSVGSSTTVMTYGAPDLPGDWTRRFAPLTVAMG